MDLLSGHNPNIHTHMHNCTRAHTCTHTHTHTHTHTRAHTQIFPHVKTRVENSHYYAQNLLFLLMHNYDDYHIVGKFDKFTLFKQLAMQRVW